jgi:hypothetical protein
LAGRRESHPGHESASAHDAGTKGSHVVLRSKRLWGHTTPAFERAIAGEPAPSSPGEMRFRRSPVWIRRCVARQLPYACPQGRSDRRLPERRTFARRFATRLRAVAHPHRCRYPHLECGGEYSPYFRHHPVRRGNPPDHLVRLALKNTAQYWVTSSQRKPPRSRDPLIPFHELPEWIGHPRTRLNSIGSSGLCERLTLAAANRRSDSPLHCMVGNCGPFRRRM